MLARSDRTVPRFREAPGDEAHGLVARFDSPDDATRALFGALRQSRRFQTFTRRLCCERSQSAGPSRGGYISK
jgi:hypothetical protein